MFVQDVRSLLEIREWGGEKSPFNLLEIWRNFVDYAKNGYDMNIYEYDNDVSVRDAIESILEDKNLKRYPEYKPFRESVFEVDKNFRNLLSKQSVRSDKSTWWKRGVLTNGRKEYADDIESLYGFRISNPAQ